MQDKIIIEYLRRSYTSVDGLWFMMIEKHFSFDKALELDTEVWKVLPKIQARKVKEMLSLEGKGITDFLKAIDVKFQAEEYEYNIKVQTDEHIQIIIDRCPWIEILKKAKREHLAHIISNAICPTELGVWLNEFQLDMEMDKQVSFCDGDSQCIWNFRKK